MPTLTGPEFESQVRTIARALWPTPGDGAAEMVGGRERDCLFRTEEVTHYIECTIRRDLEKVQSDVKKMTDYREKEAKRGVLVKLWIITHEEPSPHQREFSRANRVEILSLTQFKRKLADGESYLLARNSYPFGSARDPRNDSDDVSRVRYQPTAIRAHDDSTAFVVADIAEQLMAGRCGALTGDFGMGKSLTLREIYKEIQNAHHKKLEKLPIALNLRDHWGQTDVSEALHRHAARIGFSNPHQLVRAFNAGLVTVLLDGFDEMAPPSWGTRSEEKLRELRRDSVRLAKEFVRAARGKTGILVVGRLHFFDSVHELRDALALRNDDLFLQIDEFSDEEASEFLRANGFAQRLPDWMPRRPLLLAHLDASGTLARVLDEGAEDADRGWDLLMDRICEREALIHTTLDSKTVRSILESLASSTRCQASDTGSITAEQIAQCFRAITGADPDATARPLLNRLPGLGVLDSQKGTRTFIDSQMLDVLRGGDVRRAIEAPWSALPKSELWQQGLGQLGAAVVGRLISDAHAAAACRKAVVAAHQAVSNQNAPTLAADCVAVALCIVSEAADGIDFERLVLDGATVASLDLASSPSTRGLTLTNCEIGELCLPENGADGLSISCSEIRKIRGCASKGSLPAWILRCNIQEYDAYSTNAQILERDELSMPLRVAMTVLRKLYLQRGRGRKENALFRGIGPAGRPYVARVLELLQTQGLAYRVKSGANEAAWHSVSGMRSRVMDLLEAPAGSQDVVAVTCRGMRDS